MRRAFSTALGRHRRDLITISDLRLNCIVGIYAHERRNAQPLRVDVEMELDTRAAASTESCATTADYFAVAEQARFVLAAGRFQLLETAAHALAQLVLAPAAPDEERGAVQSVRVTLTKPDALAGSAVPSVSVWREASDTASTWSSIYTRRPYGTLVAVHETTHAEADNHAAVYRLLLGPGCSVDAHLAAGHLGPPGSPTVMPLSRGVRHEGLEARPFRALDHLRTGVVENPTDRHQTLLCVRAGGDAGAPEFEG